MENQIEIKNLSKRFRQKRVLEGINCIFKNGIYGILGPNGAGKTTMMRCITGLYSFQGTIEMNGKKIKKTPQTEIGYLPQKFGLFPELTVWEMMTYFCNLKKIPKADQYQVIEDALHMVNLISQKKTKISKLSGGMVRRLGIAQAFLGNTKVILLDEPTAGLDPEERIRFKNIISNMSKDRIIIVSTHIVEDVEACCDHIMVMNRGKKLFMGTNEKLIEYADGRITELKAGDLTQEDILFVEKSYLQDGEKTYRVIMKHPVEAAAKSNVEDGYLCLLKEH